jgi:dTDP-4-amino-4,6-dideoxygalactose transaminase
MKLPFGTIEITEKTRELVLDCLDQGRISSGRKVREFEEKFAELIGVSEAVAVSSGTDADALALAVLHDFGAQRGDEVIVPALSFVASGSAVLHAGFTPVFVDIDPSTLNIDPLKIPAAITNRTRAVMAVHLMGKPAPMDEINIIAKKHNLMVIEDAAEAHGAVYKGQMIGGLGDLSAFSLYVAHIISTGEGGIVLTDNDEYAEVLRSLRSHGRACKCRQCVSNINSGFCNKRFSDPSRGDIRFQFERIGFSSKMNELEASVGLGSLDQFETIVAKRHQNLTRMIDGFKAFDEWLWTYKEEPFEKIGPHAFPFVVKKGAPFTRDELMLHLEKEGIDGRTLFASIPTQCAGFEFTGKHLGDFPSAEFVGERGIHIGVHQAITSEHIDGFIECVSNFIEKACN